MAMSHAAMLSGYQGAPAAGKENGHHFSLPLLLFYCPSLPLPVVSLPSTAFHCLCFWFLMPFTAFARCFTAFVCGFPAYHCLCLQFHCPSLPLLVVSLPFVCGFTACRVVSCCLVLSCCGFTACLKQRPPSTGAPSEMLGVVPLDLMTPHMSLKEGRNWNVDGGLSQVSEIHRADV